MKDGEKPVDFDQKLEIIYLQQYPCTICKMHTNSCTWSKIEKKASVQYIGLNQ